MAEKMFAEMTVVEKFAVAAEMVEDAEVRAFLLDRKEKAVRKASTPRKVDPEVLERKEAMATFLGEQDEPVFAKDAAEALGITAGQARAALMALVKEGIAEGELPEKGKAKVYALAR